MATSTLTSKGQVTIPKEVRDALGLKEHDRVSFVKRGEDFVIKPVKGDILSLRGSVKPKKVPEDFEKVRRIAKKKVSEKAARK